MARPVNPDPKKPLSVSLRTSTVAWLAEVAESNGLKIGPYVAGLIEAMAERRSPPVAVGAQPVPPIPSSYRRRIAAEGCPHPLNRRLGPTCGACGGEVPR